MRTPHKRNAAGEGGASRKVILIQEQFQSKPSQNKNQVFERETFFWSMLRASIFRCDKNPSSENLIIRDMVARQWREAFQGVLHG